MGFVNKVIGVVVVFFALYSFNSGLVLSGANFTLDFNVEDTANQTETVDGIQIAKMDVDWTFIPNEFVVKKVSASFVL